MAKAEKIFIGIDDQVIELTGADKEAFIADIEETNARLQLVETEYKAKQKAREDAIKKLAEVAGLTEAELNAIL
jgi:glucokinase